jgi:hypothetical protein
VVSNGDRTSWLVRWSSLLIVAWLSHSAWCFEPFRIDVVDRQNGWPVPLIELRTTHGMRFISDNAGVIAIDSPELMGREVYFHLIGHGYGVAPDGFGYRGVRLTPRPGGSARIEVKRQNLAKRLGRLTGGGLFAESQLVGEDLGEVEAPLWGQDSVQTALLRGRLFWVWGDTTLPHYPLGVFDAVAAVSHKQPFGQFRPPLRPQLDYFLDAKTGRPRGVARFPGKGPTWLSGLLTVPDAEGREQLVASYAKIRGHLTPYERGLCRWDGARQAFRRVRVLWREDAPDATEFAWHNGHAFRYQGPAGQPRIAVGNPFPTVSFPATFEAWRDPSRWERHRPPERLSGVDHSVVRPHSGAIAYNEFRDRWIAIFVQRDGEPSSLGEVWYAESEDPFGDWGPAIKVLTHDNYTFYNPCWHPEWTGPDDPFVLFEGTYTAEFARQPRPTPRYNYNQILYRLDLNDPGLEAIGRD